MVGIYKITNPSGKIYIGQSLNIKRRWNEHKYSINKQQPKLFNSFKKHGWGKHIFEILEECSIEQLNEKEIYWKKYYLNKVKENWKQVLFCSLFDTGGGPKSENIKQKISNSKKGYKFSQESKQKMKKSALGRKNTNAQKEKLSKSLKKYYSKHDGSFKGKNHTEESKLKISKPILAFKDGILKEEYLSLKEAGEAHKTHSGNIIKAMKRNGTLHGLVWKYKE